MTSDIWAIDSPVRNQRAGPFFGYSPGDWRHVRCIDCNRAIPELPTSSYMLDPEGDNPICRDCHHRRADRIEREGYPPIRPGKISEMEPLL